MKINLPLTLFGLAALLLSARSIDAQSATPLENARAALNANDLPKAESLLVPLTDANAKDAPAFHALGQLRERQQKFKDAVAAYEQAAKLDPTKAEYFAALGGALGQYMEELNFMQQAMLAGKLKQAFEKAVELDPQNIAGLIGLSRYYANVPEIAGGSVEKAKQFALRLQQSDPFLGEIELGNVLGHDEQYAEALAHYQAAAKLKPQNANAQNLCGRMLVKLERTGEARACFESALKLNPNLGSAKKALGELNAPKG